jgi:hypothetical protein
MTKRAFWLVAGFGLGVTAATRARRHLDQVAPPGSALHVLGDRVRRAFDDAVHEGRDEMHRREVALRTVLAAPGQPDPGR